MSMIKSTLSLNDEMSQTLRNILTQLNLVNNQIKNLGIESKEIPKTISTWDVAFGNFAGNMISKVTGFFNSFIKSGFDFNRNMENSLTNFTTMLDGSVDHAQAKVEELRVFAAKTPFELGDLAQSTQTLMSFGVGAEYTTPLLRMLGDVSLGNKQKFQSLSLVMGQVVSQGKLMGGDLLQMINAGFNPLQVISEKTGQSMSELKDEMSKGAVSAQMVVEAFQMATSEGGKFYKGMESASQTFDGVMSTLKDNISSTMGTLLSPVNDAVKDMASGLINVIANLEPFISGFANFISSNMDVITTALTIVGIVAVGLGISWAITWAIANWHTLAIIGGVLFLAKILNMLGITTGDILSFIGGAFFVTFAAINNIILGFGDFVLTIISGIANVFIDFANFLANIFYNPISSIIKMFEGMANNVLEIIKGIAKAIDAIFGSNLAGIVGDWQNSVSNMANNLIEKYAPDENYREVFERVNLNMKDLTGMEHMSYGESWNKGATLGSNLANGLSDLGGGNIGDFINGLGQDSANLNNINKGIGGLNDKLSGKGSLKSVGETKIVDENLKYLRDIATFKYQSEYQRSSPQVNINVATGDINSGADENRLISKFENVVIDALVNNLATG